MGFNKKLLFAGLAVGVTAKQPLIRSPHHRTSLLPCHPVNTPIRTPHRGAVQLWAALP
ncbi:hypothetical protein [Sporisorium scitamineum]|uniref:Uncharacterized protein n=1 Tax=Sporisorium scitamineum TaxID=49012 RepID=A0A0F7S878_9BASI|nr:hypothetical protein [Sporisorium scitamineum]